MTRVAVVDLGTNSTRLLVADVEAGRVRELDRRLAITRLGEEVDEGRSLLPAAVARVHAALAAYRQAADRHGATARVAVATSAVRDAANGPEFLRGVERDFGFAPRLLTGGEEALLTFRGVTAGRPAEPGTLVVDIGGGSTELVLGGPGGISVHASLDLGCVRQTERHLRSDPPAADELSACAAGARAALAAGVPPELAAARAVGVAGTVTTLATVHLGLAEEVTELVHGHVLPAAWIEAEVARLAAFPLADRRAVRGIHTDRAPVIVAGGIVLIEVLGRFGLSELEVSEADILHGAALAAAAGEA